MHLAGDIIEARRCGGWRSARVAALCVMADGRDERDDGCKRERGHHDVESWGLHCRFGGGGRCVCAHRRFPESLLDPFRHLLGTF